MDKHNAVTPASKFIMADMTGYLRRDEEFRQAVSCAGVAVPPARPMTSRSNVGERDLAHGAQFLFSGAQNSSP
jgi:hypothetical protein